VTRRGHTSRAALASVSAVLVASALAASAQASPSYPAALRHSLALYYDPPCTLCHAPPDGGDGPVTTPFGEALVKRGLAGKDDAASLDAAIARMRKDSVDSDGDGARDLDELSWRGDPNHADLPADPNAQPPQYGCSVGARGASGGPWALGVAIALGVALARRRRGRI
jgi:MYXO-CTERM domain-containing protein